jgi:hypothetical protein
MQTSALERTIHRAAERRAPAERCDLCGVPLAEEHRHLLDTDRHEALCACIACTVLFNRDAASKGHYRLIPQRRIRLARLATDTLGVPVGLAYFVADEAGAVLAHYPSAIGATEWEVDRQAWADVLEREPLLGTLTPDVEALLVNTAWGACEHWIVGVDECFRLVAIVRREWKGLSGGGTVWPAITAFFDGLTERED